MLVTVVVVCFAIIVLLVVVLWLSFFQGLPGDTNVEYNLGNYAEVFSEENTYRVVLDTIEFSFITLIVAMGFGIPLAWLVERTDLGAKTFMYTVMTLGLLIPGFASAMGWLFFLHPRIGLGNIWLMEAFGLSEAPISITNIIGMGWVLGLNLTPLAFIMTGSVFRAMDPSLEEAARIGGANLWQTLWHITLRLAWPGILAASIFIFTIGFGAFDVPAIIGWSNRIFTFSTYLLILLSPELELPRYGAVAAFSVVIIGIALLMSWWYSSMQRLSQQYAVITGKGYRPVIVPLGRHKVTAWSFFLLYVALSKILPLLLLLWASALPYFGLPSAETFAALSLENYRSLPWEQSLRGLKNTGILMVLTPTVTMVLSLTFSWIVLRSRISGRQYVDTIAFLPHAVPNVVFSVGALLLTLYFLESVVPIYGTIWVLLAVFVIVRLSYGTRMTNSALIQIHRELEEAAQISGANTWGVLRRVIAPLLAPTLVSAWLWIALLTFRELTLAVILTTSDNLTLPVIVWSLWSHGSLGEASALAFSTLLMLLPFIVLYWSLMRRTGIFGASVE